MVRWAQFLSVPSRIWVLICLFILKNLIYCSTGCICNSTSSSRGPQLRLQQVAESSEGFVSTGELVLAHRWLVTINGTFKNSSTGGKVEKKKRKHAMPQWKKQRFPGKYAFEIGLIPCQFPLFQWCRRRKRRVVMIHINISLSSWLLSLLLYYSYVSLVSSW